MNRRTARHGGRRPTELSDLQLAVMRVLWERGRATVTEVHEALVAKRGLAPTTVATTLARLEKRGAVAHERKGRQFVYEPRVLEPDVKRSMVSALTERLFRGNAAELVDHLLTEREIEPEELERLKSLLEARRSKEED